MAHECPECGLTCHCDGDIDDVCWGIGETCSHCDDEIYGDPLDELYFDDDHLTRNPFDD